MAPVLATALILITIPPAMAADDALACYRGGPPEARVSACSRAIENAATSDMRAMALASRAEAFAALGDTMRALADYDAALALTPGDIAAVMARGLLRESTGDRAGAEADYTAVLETDAALTEALSRRGDLRFRRAAFAEAAADYEALNRAAPATPASILKLFMARARAGSMDREALTAAAAAIRGRGWADDAWPMPVLRYFLGELSGDETLDAAQAQPDRLCEAYFFLGQAGLLLDDRAEAIKLFNGIVALKAECAFEKSAARAELERLTSPSPPIQE